MMSMACAIAFLAFKKHFATFAVAVLYIEFYVKSDVIVLMRHTVRMIHEL